MQVIILAGGKGTRLAEETVFRPKPMVEIGGKPILWHIMNIYAAQGVNEFIITLGYKAEMIKEYFLNFYAINNDLTVDLATGEAIVHGTNQLPWTVHLVDTGPHTQTGGRLKRVEKWLEDDVTWMDAVVHLAELSNDPLGQLSPHITYAINHQGSVALARLCKTAGVPRFVYTSSCSVYGIGGGSAYKTETSTPQPQTAYAECKVLVERDVAAMADATFSPTFLRNATAYGPSPRMRFDLVLNNLAGLAWTTKKIHMTSDGTPWRPLVHVLDICEAIACTLEAPREVVHNEVFNVGDSRENYRVREIAQLV